MSAKEYRKMWIEKHILDVQKPKKSHYYLDVVLAPHHVFKLMNSYNRYKLNIYKKNQ